MIWTRQQYPSGLSGVPGDSTLLTFLEPDSVLSRSKADRGVLVLATSVVLVIQVL